MKKIVRRNHIKENFRQNLREQFTLGDVADVFVPGVSAYKNFQKGDIAGGLIDAGLDVASLVAGGLTGGLGYGAARGVISAVKAGKKVATVGKKVATTQKLARSSRVPNTGYGPWGKRVPTRIKGPKGKKGSTAAAAAAGATGGAMTGGGGSGGGSQPLDIYGKDRPQTGFRDRYQGINPFHSGELRQSVPFYDTTPVGGVVSRKAMMGVGRIPPSSLPEGKVYDQLQEMVNKSIKTREINDILVTQDMARNIVQLHEALNNDNKKMLEENLKSKDGFFRILDFSVRN